MTTQGLVSNKKGFAPYAQIKRDLRTISKLTDEQIVQNAATKAKRDVENSPAMKIYKALPAVVITALAGIAAASTPGKLSKRAAASAGILGVFAAGSLAAKVAEKFTNKINEPKGNKESKMNPFLKAALGIAGSIGALYLGLAGIKKGKPILAKKFPNLASKFVKFRNDIANTINGSSLGQKIGDSQRVISKNAFPAAILGYFLGAIGLGNKLNKDMDRNFEYNVNTMPYLRKEAEIALALIKQSEKREPESDAECDALCQEAKLAQDEDFALQDA